MTSSIFVKPMSPYNRSPDAVQKYLQSPTFQSHSPPRVPQERRLVINKIVAEARGTSPRLEVIAAFGQ